MSKAIDIIASLAAAGVAGYFIYKVVLPGLKDFQFPTFQFPQFPQQAPPASTPTNTSEPEQTTTTTTEEKQKGGTKTTTTTTPPPPAGPAPAAGALLYDSNTHGKWKNGQKRVVTKGDGSTGPDGKGLHTAASGNPTLTIDGNGVAHLESSKWGRIYIYAKNYNSRLEGNFMFETNHGTKDNISIKMRSRHGNNAHPQGGGNQFGGIGFAFHPDGEIELAAEIKHGGSSYNFGSLRGPPLQLGKWHKFAISVYDGGGINVKVDVDGKNVGSKKWSSPHATAIDKNAFAADSYFWIRLNCHDGKRAKAAFSNLRMYNLGGTSSVALTRNQMLYEPYLYYRYLNKRRM